MNETTYALAALNDSTVKRLLVRGYVDGFSGGNLDGLMVCRLTAENAAELRTRLPWVRQVYEDV